APILGVVGDRHLDELDPVEAFGEVAPGGEGAAGIAGEDFLERLALGRAGAVVDEEAELAVLLEDVAFPMDDEDDGKVPGDPEVAVIALADQPGEHALAIAERRIGAEIARAADGAVAQVPPVASKAPVGGVRIGLGHCGKLAVGARLSQRIERLPELRLAAGSRPPFGLKSGRPRRSPSVAVPPWQMIFPTTWLAPRAEDHSNNSDGPHRMRS